MQPTLFIALVAVLLALVAGRPAIGAERSADPPPTPRRGPSVDLSHGDLAVAPNKRFLVHKDGTPFFYLGDTAWELFHRLDRQEVDRYLENRRQKGFTVIQAVVLAELDGLGTPNAYGDLPLVDRDLARPNAAYFRHVDYVVDKAQELGVFIGMLPTWGSHVVAKPSIFNPPSAEAYGRFLGARYRDKPNLIWILGGDRAPEGCEAVWRALAQGLRQGDGGRHVMTYHPRGGQSSSDVLHAEPWLDFNMAQSGHRAKDNPNYAMVEADYNRTPTKPCMDGEPRYDDHPVRGSKTEDWFDDYDVRQAAYWALFAGAHGHTYGCHPIWMMRHPRLKDAKWPSPVRHYWDEVLDLPGAWQMMHARRLMESRPMLDRVPDQALVAGDAGTGPDHVQATRGKDYAFVYLPTGKPVTVALGRISGAKVKAWWFNPRTGEAAFIGEFANEAAQAFDPPGTPGRGNDWVLVLDDAAKGHLAPGAAPAR